MTPEAPYEVTESALLLLSQSNSYRMVLFSGSVALAPTLVGELMRQAPGVTVGVVGGWLVMFTVTESVAVPAALVQARVYVC